MSAGVSVHSILGRRSAIDTSPLDPLASAIAELVWAKLEDRLVARDMQMVSVPEAAKRIGISRTKLHAMISSGEFPKKCTRRIGSRLLVVVAELERWSTAQ